ncbi:hypothetical protein EW145_g53 [Phellinidium pouzarii]|uniref:GPN-loop GTPase 3 n=1 Tax=Phellinidium pouzarii TaxID=167371 RepID=A0A4S4LJU9_9AGAM|nr:hypothetical protein EW145_g53 [Phellinidium pouzarii]
MRYAVLVTGPAGAGKSTFCRSFLTHLQSARRTGHLVNLDPAADSASFEYEPSIDIRDLISLEDVMNELGYGPNGGLLYCFEYLLNNMDWLEEEIGEHDNDYLIFDCPGQIELYTHHRFFPTLISNLNRLGLRSCAVYLLESQFMEDRYKFFSGVMSAMSAMVNLETPWINIMSKMDLVSANVDDPAAGRNGIRRRRNIARYLDPDPLLLVSASGETESNNPRFHSLNQAIVQLIEDHPLVSFLPLDLTSTDSLENIVSHVDYVMQYGEDEEPRESPSKSRLKPSYLHITQYYQRCLLIPTHIPLQLGVIVPLALDTPTIVTRRTPAHTLGTLGVDTAVDTAIVDLGIGIMVKARMIMATAAGENTLREGIITRLRTRSRMTRSMPTPQPQDPTQDVSNTSTHRDTVITQIRVTVETSIA